MEKQKHFVVKNKVWIELMNLKMKHGFTSMNALFEALIKNTEILKVLNDK